MAEPIPKGGLETGTLVRLVVAGLLGLALLAFVVQNRDDVQVDWLMIDVTLPLWLLLVIAAALGAGLGGITNWGLRRRKN